MKRIFTCRLIQLIIMAACYSSTGAFADINDSGVKITWGYKGDIGPDRWGQLSPAFVLCANGKRQSPINITKNVTNVSGGLVMDYRPSPMMIEADGVTNLMIGNTQTIIHDGHGIQLNFANRKATEIMTFKGKKYHLVQFHLHSPSENELNGQDYPLEIHFVHQSDDGKVAVIGVFVKGGAANTTLQKIIDHIPKDKGVEHAIKGETINPVDLIPAKHDYYSFTGSLTTPPCTEGLQWIVMPDTISASPAQIVFFRAAVGGENARPVQPLNERVVKFSKVKS